MRPCIRAALLAAIALATILLGTCSETNIVALLTSEVKRANNKFLVVESVEPANSTTNTDPGAPIRIVFDRAVDIATLTESNITITPSAGFALDFQFNDLTNTLSIFVDPYLDNSTDYTLTVTKGVLAADGSDLESEFAWSFRTGIFPAGNVSINSGATYTNNPTVTLNLTANAVVFKYRAAQTEPDLATKSYALLDLSPSFSFDTGDGTKTVYIQFIDSTGMNESTVRSDTIILDTVQPTITVYSLTIYQNLTMAAAPSITGSDDRSGVDPTTYLWAGGGVTFTPGNNVQAPSISAAGVDGTYPVTVTVKDLAGNTSAAATVNVIKDTVPPNAAPLVTATTPSPAFTPSPRWDWSAQSGTGGETPVPYFKYELRNDAGTLFYGRSSTTGRYYYPKLEWPNYTRGTPPDTYTMTVWERDLAGNLSSPATSVVDVTSVLPVDGTKGVSLTPTLQWWTMSSLRDPSIAPEYYVLHYGTWDGRIFKEIDRVKVLQPIPPKEPTDPFYAIPVLLRASVAYGWYVEVPEFDLRSPPLESKVPYWVFTTGKF